ncbi:hypothetical protein [Nitrosopumilus sp. S6]
MFIKLGIIIGIVVLGGMVFSNEIDTLFPSTSATVVDSIKSDVSNFGAKASDSVEKRIDQSIDKIVDSTSNAITEEISEAGDKISNEITETRESSQEIISEEISNFNPVESIKNLFSDNSETTTTTQSSQSETITTNNQSPLIHETLSLSTTQESTDEILLQYSDSSGKTQSVDVIIRTNEKEIFSGTFFTSNFETTVHDISSTPYYVDMIVEHEDYGTVTSSVFNPGDSSDSQINGIFSQS